MPYSSDSLTLQVGRTEAERSFVWLQETAFPTAHLSLAALSDYERDGGFTAENTTRYEAEITTVRKRGDYLSCKVTVSELAPADYIYRVGCDTEEDAECYTFTVRGDVDRGQTFVLFSDLHTNVYRRALNKWDPEGKQARASFRAELEHAAAFMDKPDFFLSVGDNISVCNMPASFYPNPEEFSNCRAAD